MKTLRKRFLLIVLSGPSGVGKTTVGLRLLRMFPAMRRSVSWTTRPPRPGERQGKDYQFVSEAKFAALAAKNGFLEYARVHGHLYGTPKKNLAAAQKAGRDLLLIIDVQGAARVRRNIRRGAIPTLTADAFTDIFLMPPSLAELRRRIVGRGDVDPKTLARRLKTAKTEMLRSHEYTHCVVNDKLERAVSEIAAIIKAKKAAARAAQKKGASRHETKAS